MTRKCTESNEKRIEAAAKEKIDIWTLYKQESVKAKRRGIWW